MKRTAVLQEIRKMQFARIYRGWRQKKFTQEDAARLLGVTDRTFRRYIHRYEESTHPAREQKSVFVPWAGGDLEDILCEQYQRTVNNDNCVNFGGLTLQIPADKYRCHYVEIKVRAHRYDNGCMAIFHGPCQLARYDKNGNLLAGKETFGVAT